MKNEIIEQNEKFEKRRYKSINKKKNIKFNEHFQQPYFNIEEYSQQYFSKHIYFFKYQGMIREILLNYKFKDKSYLYKTIVNFILKDKKIFEILNFYDIIIPVPISKQRKKQRGYNQSLLIAREISKIIGIPCQNKCLLKTKEITEQSKLNKEDRIKNVQGVYKLKNANLIKNKRVLLIDDIYTTGSTARECCKILNQGKVKNIDVLTIAKD